MEYFDRWTTASVDNYPPATPETSRMSTTGPTGEQIPGHDIGFGIDIGGSGIKGAPVNLATGQFLAKRLRLPTPANSTPDAVGAVLAQIVAHFDLPAEAGIGRSEEHTSELQSRGHHVCRLLLEKKK